MRPLYVLAFVSLLAPLSGCASSSSNPGSGGSGGAPADAGPVSFKMQVYPIFQNSCGLSDSCHKVKGVRVYLGAKTDTNASGVRMGIVNVMSVDDKTMPYVSPGMPDNSFLWHKVDGDLTSIKAMCGGDCQTQMPMGSPPLPMDEQDLIQNWIAQGALDN